MALKLPPGAPYAPTPYSVEDVTALQALDSGRDVPAYVAKRALDWIILHCAGTYDLSFRPGEQGDRETAFAEGRRFVGLQIVKLLKLNVQQLRQTDGRQSSDGRDRGRRPAGERKPDQ